jgi:CDP-glucose 4,6-dehydratase
MGFRESPLGELVMSDNLPDASFWQGKRVLITGHTGFKGSWLTIWLNKLGAQTFGISLEPNSEPNLFDLANVATLGWHKICDVCNAEEMKTNIRFADPEIVFHLAAQPLVRESYRDPARTFNTNVLGTVNVLEALRGLLNLKTVVVVTTDKVYEDKELKIPYNENQALGGHDPYSASKAACELVVASYRQSYFKQQNVALASARAGNVIGGGDWSADRLIPDTLRSWQNKTAVEIRQPNSVRPWQHVLEALSGYMVLAEKIHGDKSLAGAYNFGPCSEEEISVKELVDLMSEFFADTKVTYPAEVNEMHESDWIGLDTAKADQILNFRSSLTVHESVTRTMQWYIESSKGKNARELCEADIAQYESLRRKRS